MAVGKEWQWKEWRWREERAAFRVKRGVGEVGRIEVGRISSIHMQLLPLEEWELELPLEVELYTSKIDWAGLRGPMG